MANVSDERPADTEYTERVTMLRLEMEELVARLCELEDDMRHDDNVARVNEEWRD